MKLYKVRSPDCIYCLKYNRCNVLNKYFDCFVINPDLVLSRDLALKIVKDSNVDLSNDFIKFQAECEVIYHEN